MNETELEHIYIICENVNCKKDHKYSKLYKNIKKMYGEDGIEILELIQEKEVIERIKWIKKNPREYNEQVNLRQFDLKRVEYKQMTLKEFNKRYEDFRFLEDLLQQIN